MFRSRSVLVLAPVAVCALLAGAPSSAAAHDLKKPGAPKITIALEERLITQQSLLIGIASNVLQSQFQLDFYLSPGEVGHCQALSGGGSDEVQSATTKGRVTTGVNVLYYDAGCKRKYMVQTATYTAGGGSQPINKLTASNVYYGPTGTKLGVMTTAETAQSKGGSELLNGVGTFHVVGLKTPVSLGLGCDLDEGGTSIKGKCQGGVAQDFPALNYSLGSVVPVSLIARPGGLTFSATSAIRRAGALHALSIVKGKPQQLTLKGTGVKAGSTLMKGHAGSFSLFPPPPTGWTVTDNAHHLMVTLNVTKGAARNLSGTITSTKTRKTLAKITLDQSGTGRLRYAGGAASPITSWILTK